MSTCGDSLFDAWKRWHVKAVQGPRHRNPWRAHRRPHMSKLALAAMAAPSRVLRQDADPQSQKAQIFSAAPPGAAARGERQVKMRALLHLKVVRDALPAPCACLARNTPTCSCPALQTGRARPPSLTLFHTKSVPSCLVKQGSEIMGRRDALIHRRVATKRGDREQALAEMREAKAAVAASGGDNYPGCSLCGLPDHKRRACPSRTTALVPEAAVLAASPAPKDETPRKTAEVSAKRQKTC